ncbi:hypothetical protein [Diaphorobacter aerolatus]|uniref:Uncharacterized protein n=1 Tax=Diaphorobacter aerolatus TaxID=1288495 RepID=A0A7H0GJB6_9BURK|nr:hypothetical protein [Diaphorobacter aerolatus]QNP48382.1 hypothetical protein H9K75_20905 [Diaphorobacter aerolatus]
MRQHIRIDGLKVFPEDDKVLKAIMSEHKLSEKQGKSRAYRIALERYQDTQQLHQEVASLTAEIRELKEQIAQLYFVVQGGVQ